MAIKAIRARSGERVKAMLLLPAEQR